MLLDFPAVVQRYKLDIADVLHVGAHLAEEAPVYDRLGVDWVTWVEGNPDLIGTIKKVLLPYDNQVVKCALITNQDGDVVKFNITNYDSMSSSIFEFGTHTKFSPDTKFVDKKLLPTRTLDSLWESPSLLVMDLQGAELQALQGAGITLQSCKAVYTEINRAQVYEGCAQFDDVDKFLRGVGFEFREAHWTPNDWGDGLWTRV